MNQKAEVKFNFNLELQRYKEEGWTLEVENAWKQCPIRIIKPSLAFELSNLDNGISIDNILRYDLKSGYYKMKNAFNKSILRPEIVKEFNLEGIDYKDLRINFSEENEWNKNWSKKDEDAWTKDNARKTIKILEQEIKVFKNWEKEKIKFISQEEVIKWRRIKEEEMKVWKAILSEGGEGFKIEVEEPDWEVLVDREISKNLKIKLKKENIKIQSSIMGDDLYRLRPKKEQKEKTNWLEILKHDWELKKKLEERLKREISSPTDMWNGALKLLLIVNQINQNEHYSVNKEHEMEEVLKEWIQSSMENQENWLQWKVRQWALSDENEKAVFNDPKDDEMTWETWQAWIKMRQERIKEKGMAITNKKEIGEDLIEQKKVWEALSQIKNQKANEVIEAQKANEVIEVQNQTFIHKLFDEWKDDTLFKRKNLGLRGSSLWVPEWFNNIELEFKLWESEKIKIMNYVSENLLEVKKEAFQKEFIKLMIWILKNKWLVSKTWTNKSIQMTQEEMMEWESMGMLFESLETHMNQWYNGGDLMGVWMPQRMNDGQKTILMSCTGMSFEQWRGWMFNLDEDLPWSETKSSVDQEKVQKWIDEKIQEWQKFVLINESPKRQEQWKKEYQLKLEKENQTRTHGNGSQDKDIQEEELKNKKLNDIEKEIWIDLFKKHLEGRLMLENGVDWPKNHEDVIKNINTFKQNFENLEVHDDHGISKGGFKRLVNSPETLKKILKITYRDSWGEDSWDRKIKSLASCWDLCAMESRTKHIIKKSHEGQGGESVEEQWTKWENEVKKPKNEKQSQIIKVLNEKEQRQWQAFWLKEVMECSVEWGWTEQQVEALCLTAYEGFKEEYRSCNIQKKLDSVNRMINERGINERRRNEMNFNDVMNEMRHWNGDQRQDEDEKEKQNGVKLLKAMKNWWLFQYIDPQAWENKESIKWALNGAMNEKEEWKKKFKSWLRDSIATCSKEGVLDIKRWLNEIEYMNDVQKENPFDFYAQLNAKSPHQSAMKWHHEMIEEKLKKEVENLDDTPWDNAWDHGLSDSQRFKEISDFIRWKKRNSELKSWASWKDDQSAKNPTNEEDRDKEVITQEEKENQKMMKEVKVKVLNSEKALGLEGKLMHHCVGGRHFKEQSKNGCMIIFHLEHEPSKESCTWSFEKNQGAWELLQNKGKYNSEVKNEALLAVGKDIMERLNILEQTWEWDKEISFKQKQNAMKMK